MLRRTWTRESAIEAAETKARLDRQASKIKEEMRFRRAPEAKIGDEARHHQHLLAIPSPELQAGRDAPW